MQFFFLACLAVASALELSKVGEPIQDSYIVLFKKNVSDAMRRQHMSEVDVHSEVVFEYNFPGFQGYNAKMESKALAQVLESPLLRLVEQDGVVRAITEALPPMPVDSPDACVTQTGATWGIVRTAEEDLVITGEYKYEEGAGAGVTTYVVDTGIYIQHNDFGGRASWGANFVDNDDTDGNGHGTHVASTMVGNTYGLAKSATVKAVKVLNAAGSGSFAGVIAGINWVVEDSISLYQRVKRAAKSVANMSLGGSKSAAVNDAVDAAYANDVLFANAAGNDGRDACNYSPASAPDGISVGASDNRDAMASFSNWGTCVDIFGPGVSITAAWIGNPTSDNTISGTSMAAPHVAGVIAKLMKDFPDYDAEKMKAEVTATATSNKLSGVRGSPNLLTYHGCVSDSE